MGSAPDMLRLFIALPCPASRGLRRVLRELQEMGRGVKAVEPENLHITLRFFGETSAARLPVLAEAMDAAVTDAAPGPTTVRWAGLGRFPVNDRQPAKVIFAEPAHPEPLHRLARALDGHLAKLEPAMPPADRPFNAHLTLGRLKVSRRRQRGGASHHQSDMIDDLCRRHAPSNVRTHAHSDLGWAELESMQLIASELTPSGPVYTVRHEAKL